jgi:hypothetical protein
MENKNVPNHQPVAIINGFIKVYNPTITNIYLGGTILYLSIRLVPFTVDAFAPIPILGHLNLDTSTLRLSGRTWRSDSQHVSASGDRNVGYHRPFEVGIFTGY